VKKLLSIAALNLTILLGSCTKKQVKSDDSILGLDYYPTNKGKYVVYDVDSTVYVQLTKDTLTYKYRVKEKITDSFTDNEGKQALRMERYVKKYNPNKSYDSIPWTIKEVWMVNADNKSVQVVESNVRYTKLIFPVQENATWNGNANNTLGDWDYSYNYIEKTEVINKNKIESVLMVRQKLYSTGISYQSYAEKYAKGIGLVYREIYDVASGTIQFGVPVLNRIESGIVYKQNFVSMGYE
jgi:hypothetical protein